MPNQPNVRLLLAKVSANRLNIRLTINTNEAGICAVSPNVVKYFNIVLALGPVGVTIIINTELFVTL